MFEYCFIIVVVISLFAKFHADVPPSTSRSDYTLYQWTFNFVWYGMDDMLWVLKESEEELQADNPINVMKLVTSAVLAIMRIYAKMKDQLSVVPYMNFFLLTCKKHSTQDLETDIYGISIVLFCI
jgi:hypothetical protein